MKPTTRYVLVVAVDLKTRFCVSITKRKGPAFLLDKLTFPGGKLEAGETAIEAGRRELLEEVGIDVPAAHFKLVELTKGDGYELTKLVVVTDKVLQARQCEQEPVWHLAIERHLGYALTHPMQYAPDFRSTLLDALRRVDDPVTRKPLAEAA